MPDAPIVIGLGELLWDVFPDSRRPGGAPANVAFHANQLGSRGLVASRVGIDADGDELIEFLARRGLDTSLIQRDAVHPTGRVTVDLADERRPEYVIHTDAAWDYLEASGELLAAAGQAAAVCFGTLAQRCAAGRDAIHRGLAACNNGLIVYDVNLRQSWYDRGTIERSLAAASIVKLNRDEAHVLAPLLGLARADLQLLARQLIDRFDLRLVCITRAEEGCLLVTNEEAVDDAGRPVDVVDAVGAGDAFTAALITARLERWPLAAIAQYCNAVGGLVASRAGAMPALSDELSVLRRDHAP